MRMWVLVGVLTCTAFGLSSCKKKSECVQRVERYLACDEAKPNPERACRDMPPEAKLELERCDAVAQGDCNQFLICTGVKSAPRDGDGPDASQAAINADPTHSVAPSPSPAAADAGTD